MLRVLLLGSILLVLGVAFRNGWVVVSWDKLFTDINLPFLAQPEPANQFNYKRP